MVEAARKKLQQKRKFDHLDEKDRPFNSLNDSDEVTKEEMEAYRLEKARANDPLRDIKKAKKSQTLDHDYV